MDKIDPFFHGLFAPDRKKDRRLEKKKKSGKAFRSFLSTETQNKSKAVFHSSALPPGIDNINEAVDHIFELGDKLKRNPDRENVLAYKEAVSSFIRYVLGKGLVVEETQSGANILKRKRYTLVSVIDEKLDKLAADVLLNQKEQLSILKRIDEINGLIVDLLG